VIARQILSLLLWLDRYRKRDAVRFHAGVTVAISTPAIFIWERIVRHFLPEKLQFFGSSPFVFELFLSVLTGIVVAAVINPVLPTLLYLPYAAAMRSMGLLRATTAPGELGRLLEQYLKMHDDTSIRVICISGRHLFREPKDAETPAPLAAAAKNGRLRVVMPISIESNATVRARWNSYTKDYREQMYPEPKDLILEIDQGKAFLKKNGNDIVEHDILCMWRVVLLSGHCLVQNYFPNLLGADSDRAPVFVFENSPECDFSYYRTFETMFDLISNMVSPVS
jgi:hypothetical protein